MAAEVEATLLGAASVCHLIDAATLAQRVAADAATVAAALLPNVETDRGPDAVTRWTLRPAVRRRCLAAASPEAVARWIALGDGVVPTEVERVLRDWLTNHLDVCLRLEASGDAVRTVAGWLQGCSWVQPVPEEVLREIARSELRGQLERAKSPTFVGRKRELAELRAMLGAPNGIAVLEAKGGMGKSALLAQYFLQRGAFTTNGPVLMLVDFDDTGMSLDDPQVIFAEMARQAALQEGRVAGFESSFREHGAQWRGRGRSGRRFEDSRLLSSAHHFLNSLASTGRESSIVLDTLERAQHASPELVDDFVLNLRGLAARKGLSVLIAGRGPLQLPSLDGVPRLKLAPLARQDATEMLSLLGVSDGLAVRILHHVVPTPLTLRLVARAVSSVGTDALDDAELLRAVARARVDGYLHARILEHLPTMRLAHIAKLGLGLLSLTPTSLLDVLGPLVDPPIQTPAEADLIFEELAAVSDLVVMPSHDRRLVFRTEIWLELLELLREEDPGALHALHVQAAASLENATSPNDVLERAYYLLSLGRVGEVEHTPELVAGLNHLTPSLPAFAQGWLRRPRGDSQNPVSTRWVPRGEHAVLDVDSVKQPRILRVQLCLVMARSDQQRAREELTRVLPDKAAWVDLVEEDRALVRQAAALLESREALRFAAEVGAFDWSGRLDFTELGEALAKFPRLRSTLELVGGSGSTGDRISEANRQAPLTSFVLLLLGETDGDRATVKALSELLQQMQDEGEAAPESNYSVEKRASALEMLSSSLGNAVDRDTWQEIVSDVSMHLGSRWERGDFENAVHNALLEMDRYKLGETLISTLTKRGLHRQAALALDLFAPTKKVED